MASLETVEARLTKVPLDPWGPDDARYVCLLFWNQLGLRLIRNTAQEADWKNWHASSGDFWDLFLAGACPIGRPSEGAFGDEVILWDWDSGRLGWSWIATQRLIDQVQAKAVGTHGHWQFVGPLELAVVAARRPGKLVDIEWESLRAAPVGAERLGAAVAYYTEAHIRLDPEILQGEFPVPGDFTDDMPPEAVALAMLKHLPVLAKLFRQLS